MGVSFPTIIRRRDIASMSDVAKEEGKGTKWSAKKNKNDETM